MGFRAVRLPPRSASDKGQEALEGLDTAASVIEHLTREVASDYALAICIISIARPECGLVVASSRADRLAVDLEQHCLDAGVILNRNDAVFRRKSTLVVTPVSIRIDQERVAVVGRTLLELESKLEGTGAAVTARILAVECSPAVARKI